MAENVNDSNDLNNPHDKFFKGAFSMLDVTYPLLVEFLPKDLLDKLDLNTLEIDPNSYINDELKETFSDLVWSCQLKNNQQQRKIAFLFEHKSYKPVYPHFQINDYQRNAWKTQIAANQVAAVIIEVVQGEGGFGVVSKAYLQELRKICTEKGIVLILDEVQSGFGRTGTWAAYEHFDVEPDLSTWAKSMGSGMPIGCVIGKTDIMDGINTGTIGGTYSGNPVCSAAALATIKYMEEIDINAHGQRVGKAVLKRFKQMAKKHPQIIGDVRGLGAMLAFEVVKNGDLNQPDADLTKKIIAKCNERGLIVISAGVNGNVIRTLSPLVITDKDLKRGLDILEEVVDELAR